MEDQLFSKKSTRRDILRHTGAIVSLMAMGAILLKNSRGLTSKNIEDVQEEFSMLTDIKFRRKKLGDAPLIIENADFKNTVENLECENTRFIGCYFYPGVFIRVKSLKDVLFEKCQFMNANIGQGIWDNVTFRKTDGRGKFVILGGEGSKKTFFDECDFMGLPPNKNIIHENYFGAAGSAGDTVFNNCNLKYMRLYGEAGLSITNSKLQKISAPVQDGGGILLVEKVKCKEYLNFKNSRFSSIRIDDSEIDDLQMINVEGDDFVMSRSSARLLGHGLVLRDAKISDCMFHDNGDPSSVGEREFSGFSTLYGKIDNLEINNVGFQGSNGSLFAGGAVNVYYDPRKLKKSQPIDYATYGRIFIKKTSLKGASFAYVHAKEVTISDCDIVDANFDHSTFDVLTLRQVTLAGKIDFTDTIVKQLKQDGVRRRGDLTLIKTGATVDI
ncbi:hypothetical protein [Janthinobacterium agaricidamnosum]|uniref:Tat (Twin-arginine translocation) pathway signal sequence domain protein n=1 Tax=Janthinobacterium agaricidamnosum NBRC 102515 = DSM 9628 TaxID=1349767 RepID=W0V8Z7_9BURK|nr:hypothetical protein [Janthinobacterium agaricidamnosum]CDG84351.1 tat (twin-arginine translocation) pathway signal sequence domain protein [Janthinobacterium agaricidamnosum NBRC 102515 = DSM 9628]